MKNIILFCLWCVAVIQVQAQGVNFRELTYEEALKAAKAEKKLVFLDAYTSWCGPCKQMAREVFTREDVGEFLNTRFVCVKYDMGRGDGPRLQKLLKINAYPSFLIIRPEGTEQHRIVGGYGAGEFIRRVNEGLDQRTSKAFLQQAYVRGERSNDLLIRYVVSLLQGNQIPEARQVADELWAKLGEEKKCSSDYWPVYADFRITPITSDRFLFLLDHKAELVNQVGAGKVNGHLYDVYSRYLYPYVAGLTDTSGLQEAETVMARIAGQLKKTELPDTLQKALEAKLNIGMARVRGDKGQLLTAYEEGCRHIPEAELWRVVSALSFLKDKSTPHELARVIAIVDSSVAQAQREELKGYLRRLGESFKRRAKLPED